MDEHAAAQGVGAKLWSEQDERRRSRLLAGQNFGGAQGDVGWIEPGEAGPLHVALGCPLRGSATMQACASPTSTPGPRSKGARDTIAVETSRRCPQGAPGRPSRPVRGRRGGPGGILGRVVLGG